ncbi:MAG: methyltransferase domain-containing protein [Kofleriaceae bacterium]
MRAALIILGACAPAAPPAFDVVAASHKAADDFDHGRAAPFTAVLAPGYVHTEAGAPRDRETELKRLAKYDPDAMHVATRTWKDEKSFIHGAEAVYTGQAIEKSTGKYGGYGFDGRYTFVWHYDRGWQLELWAWTAGGDAAERDTWNEMFKRGTGFNPEPNKLLVETASKLTPGVSLDLMSGQGRNVLWMAGAGWQATGIDYSHEGMEHARATAKTKGLTVNFVEADLDHEELGAAKYDLVTMIYAGDDRKLLAKAQAAIKPGGTFIYENFAQPDDTDRFKPGEIEALFAGWEIQRNDTIVGEADWGAGMKAPIMRFVARKK